MRRWHSEVVLMHDRWHVEMDKHGYDWRCPPTDPNACHCATGIGSMRERTLRGHNRRCFLCKGPKYLPKARDAAEHKALDLELRASARGTALQLQVPARSTSGGP